MRELRSRERGYNLVEVLIAVALLAVVSLSIMTLFFMARSNVYSGKQMTHAISLGTRMTEDMSQMSVPSLMSTFSITSTATLGGVSVAPTSLPESTYSGSIVRSTTSIATAGTCTGVPQILFSNDPNKYLQSWYCQMNSSSNQLQNGTISLVFTPRNPNPTAATLTFGNATVVRVRAIIRWTEGLRNRQLVLDLTKTARPLS